MLLPNRISSITHGKFRNFQRNHFSTLLPLEYLLNKLLNSSFWCEWRGQLSSTGVKCSARHPLLCVTMASSGLAATDRQLHHPPLGGCQLPWGFGMATGPDAPPWARVCCSCRAWARAWARTWVMAWAWGLSLGISLGLGQGLVTVPDTPPWVAVPLGYSLTHFPSQLAHRAPQKPAMYFLYGFLWSKGRKPCRPVHLLYLLSELQWGWNRKKITKSAPRWI